MPAELVANMQKRFALSWSKIKYIVISRMTNLQGERLTRDLRFESRLPTAQIESISGHTVTKPVTN
jgi:hypothetical protein